MQDLTSKHKSPYSGDAPTTWNHLEALKWPQTVPYTRWYPSWAPEDPPTSEDRFPPNTDWGQNRAKIGNLGQNQTSKYDESTYLPGFYGHRVLKGLIVQA